MFKSTQISEDFQHKTGDFSTRISARGFGDSNNTLEVMASLKDQYDALRERLKTTPRGSVRENIIREIGDMRLTLESGSRFAFEAIFVRVAKARLPEKMFYLFVEEARSYWRREGFADLTPPPSPRVLRKNFKREIKRMREKQ